MYDGNDTNVTYSWALKFYLGTTFENVQVRLRKCSLWCKITWRLYQMNILD